MATRTRIIPEHEYPHVMVVEHDNSQRPNDKAAAVLQTYCNMLFVIASPKGMDREIYTIDGGYTDFIEHYGLGSYDDYGQPYLNALNAASTDAATLYILRVTADNATYAGGALVAHYRVTEPKQYEPEPEPEPNSELIDTSAHENVVTSDSVDEETGVITIKVAGTEVFPGISPENADLFGDVDSTNCIDVGLKLGKMIPNLDPDKEYQITQVNPMLGKYLDKDEYVSAEGSSFKKVKVYPGSALAGDDVYVVLLGTEPVNVSISEWGVKEEEPVVDVIVTNNTDLYVEMVDDQGHITVTKTSNVYDVMVTGSIVPEISNPEQWGDIDETQFNELLIKFPTVAGKTYHMVTRNDNTLKLYPDDPRIKDVTIDGETFKIKESEFDGGVLNADDPDGGMVFLLPEKGSSWAKFYDADSFVSLEASTPVFTVNMSSNATFIAEHPLPVPAMPEALGDPVEIVVEPTLAFQGERSNISTLKANAAVNKMMRVARASVVDETPEEEKGKLEVYYTFEPLVGCRELTMLGEMINVDREPDANGFTAVKIFEIASKGRGQFGNDTRFVITNYARGDKLGNFKNYTFTVYEIDTATLVKKEYFTASFLDNAFDPDGVTLFLDYLVGDPYMNSEYIEVKTNHGAIRELHEAYLRAVPDTGVPLEQFDPLLGKVFGNNLATLPQLYILDQVPAILPDPGDASAEAQAARAAANTQAYLLNAPSGIAFMGGDDGDLTLGNPNRERALHDAYLKAYSGEIDRTIFSRKLFPTDIILDADFPVETKNAISDLVHTRKDCMGFFDLGKEFNTFEGMLDTLADIEPFTSTRDESVEAYYGKIQDPKTFKIITVTSTYPLARMYPLHFQANGAKHVALAGSSYGVLNGYINKSAYPVFDDDLELDRRQMDQMVDARINYLKVNSLKQVVRATQTTRQDADTNLSECSNVFVLHDIRRDCIMLCEQYEYNFAEASDLQRFNKAAGIIADKYAAAQVSSISAVFDMDDWEAERGILHLYVEFVHKRIVKRSIVEIDINRGKVVV